MCSHQPVTGHALSPGRSSHFGFLQPRALPQLWVVSSDIPRSGGIGVRKNGSPGWQQWYPILPTSCATRIYFFMILCSRSPFTRASQWTKDLVLQVECLLQVARSCSKIPRVTLWYLLVCAINFTWYLFQMQKPLIQKGLPTWMVRWQGCLCRSLDLPQSPLEASLKAGSFWYHLVNGSEQISKCRIHCLQDPKNPTKHCASFLVGCVCVYSVSQLCQTVWDPMDCSQPGSSVHRIFRPEYCSGLPFPSAGDLPDSRIQPASLMTPSLAGRFFITLQPGKPSYYTQS